MVNGIAAGCRVARGALIGGETAEMPGLYAGGDYDLAGFAVGAVERDAILPRGVAAGDVLLGLASSGLHSNGYSLARKVLLEQHRLDEVLPDLGETLVDVMLRPTRIYAREVRAALEAGEVRALCHITGGGLPGNLPRVLPDGLGARIEAPETPPIFARIAREGGVSLAEMRRTFNMGVGLVIVTPASDVAKIESALRAVGEAPFPLGTVIETPGAMDEARVVYAP